jgi:hypothetical protein
MDPDAAYERALRSELDRRITELAAAPDDAFGRVGAADGILVTVLFVVFPALLVWMYR